MREREDELKQQSRAVLSLLLAMLVIMSGAQVTAGTQAAFSDTANINSVTFASGSVNLQLANTNSNCNDVANVYNSETLGTAIVNVASAKPGDVATGFMCLKNTGSLVGRWSLSSAVNETNTTLASALIARVWKQDPTQACAAGLDNTGAATSIAGVSGTELYAPAALSAAPSIAAAANTELAANTGLQKVCLAIALPAATSDSDPDVATTKQGASVAVNLTVTLTNT